jgi:hypothetical protein
MSHLAWWIAGGLALLVLAIAYVLYQELKNQHHIWHAPCVTPPETQADIREVLKRFAKVMEGKSITWWLDYGTLLGAWRLGDVMAFDHDIDLSFLASDQEKMLAAKAELEAEGITWVPERTSLFFKGRKIGDLEPWHEYDGKLCRDDPKMRETVMRFWRPLVDDFPAKRIAPLWSVRFNGAMYPCPNHPEKHLRHRYLTCRLSLRLVYPHKQRCWRDKAFWAEARRIRTCKDAPFIVRQAPASHGSTAH